jgi:hypothetical protein
VITKLPSSTDTIICVVTLDLHSNIGSFLFHSELALNWIASTRSALMALKDHRAGMVHINSITSISTPQWAVARVSNNPTRNRWHIVVAAEAISWLRIKNSILNEIYRSQSPLTTDRLDRKDLSSYSLCWLQFVCPLYFHNSKKVLWRLKVRVDQENMLCFAYFIYL